MGFVKCASNLTTDLHLRQHFKIAVRQNERETVR